MQQLRPLLWQAVRFVSFGTLMTPISFGVYMAFIHLADLGVMTSSVLRAICMTPVIFLVSRYLTWRKGRLVCGFWRQFWRYIKCRPVTLLLHQGVLLGAVAVGVHHALAYWVAVSLTGIFNFFYQKYIFGERNDDALDT